MQFSPKLLPVIFLRRYKRFLVDVRLKNGEEITVHCPNTGSMTRCLVTGSPCWLSDSQNPKRKYRYSLEWVTTTGGFLAGIHSQRANALVVEALANQQVLELVGYDRLLTEVTYGDENSRIDILLSSGNEQCYVEVKSVTLEVDDVGEGNRGQGYFPDTVSLRGQKHLRELIVMRERGHRCVLFFCVQHTGINRVSAAAHIDSNYASLLAKAIACGVEVLVYGVSFTEDEVKIVKRLTYV